MCPHVHESRACARCSAGNFTVSFQFVQGAPPRPTHSGLLQSLIPEGKLASWRPSFGLLKAAGAARLPVHVQLRRHGVGDHAFQDVVLRGHHVLDEEIGGVIDVEVVL